SSSGACRRPSSSSRRQACRPRTSTATNLPTTTAESPPGRPFLPAPHRVSCRQVSEATAPVPGSQNMIRRRVALGVALLLASSLATGCGRQGEAAGKRGPPAKVAHPVKEGDLNTVVLTPEAEKRLGVETAPAEQRSVRRMQSYGGEITLPTNALLTVSAPV